ncbi:MAG: YqgE/AlgH family protein [Pirellulales bacterium]
MASQSLQGHLLIASPKLLDPNFARAVVLIVEHNQQGALGIILNRPMKIALKDAWETTMKTPCESGERLYQGGPCEGPLMVLHAEASLSGTEVLPGVHFTVESNQVEQIVAGNPEPARFFAGFAGWAAGQLEAELAEGAWLTRPATVEQVFSREGDSWEIAVKESSGDTLLADLKIKHIPDDPSVN